MSQPACEPLELWCRFPAAHQYLRYRLVQEIFPIAPALTCELSAASAADADSWRVRLRWPVIEFDASEQFAGDELRYVFGRWSDWARHCAGEIADRLPV